MRAFKVNTPGMFTTVQDEGRYGFLKYGVPISGAMDAFSLHAANALVENDPGSACLEFTLIGPELEVLSETQIAITGGHCLPEINSESVSMWKTVTIEKGDTLSFGKMQSGCRGYVSVRGGIDTPEILGSRSTYVRGGFGGLSGRQLKKEDMIEAVSAKPIDKTFVLKKELIPRFPRETTINVLMGPQNDMFTQQGIETFLSSPYRITAEADRMGYRLEGSEIELIGKSDIISDPLLPGAIQVPKNGKPIVIMRDAQTTGGYAKIAVTITPDVSVLGQAKSNDEVRFAKITLDIAQKQVIQYCKMISNIEKMMIET
jgi:antagonist of KipI